MLIQLTVFGLQRKVQASAETEEMAQQRKQQERMSRLVYITDLVKEEHTNTLRDRWSHGDFKQQARSFEVFGSSGSFARFLLVATCNVLDSDRAVERRDGVTLVFAAVPSAPAVDGAGEGVFSSLQSHLLCVARWDDREDDADDEERSENAATGAHAAGRHGGKNFLDLDFKTILSIRDSLGNEWQFLQEPLEFLRFLLKRPAQHWISFSKAQPEDRVPTIESLGDAKEVRLQLAVSLFVCQSQSRLFCCCRSGWSQCETHG